MSLLRKSVFLTAALLLSSSAFASETFMITYKGNVSVTALAQVMANRYGQNVVITRAQIRSRANPETFVQKFIFTAMIGKGHQAQCAFVRTKLGDGIACRSKTAKFDNIRVNWKTDLSR